MPKKWFRNLFAPKALSSSSSLSSSPQRGLLVGDETNENNSKQQLKLGQRQSHLPQKPSHHKTSTSSSSSSSSSSSRRRSCLALWCFRRNKQQSQEDAADTEADAATTISSSSRTSAILCCWVCDMRVATIGFNLAHILCSTLLVTLELWGYSYSVFRPPPLLFILACLFSTMGIVGAFYFHWTATFVSTIGLIWLLVLYMSENHIFGVFLLCCILFCHILFMLEMKKGILTRDNYHNQKREQEEEKKVSHQEYTMDKMDQDVLPSSANLLYDAPVSRDVKETAATELLQDVAQQDTFSLLSRIASLPLRGSGGGVSGSGADRCTEEF